MPDEPAASTPPAFEPPSPEELGAMLPQYQVEGFIAQGGMGAVYLARQAALDRSVAIKVLSPEWGGGDIDFAARFQIEARAMAKLQHSNIVSVYDFGQTETGLLYLVMEYVDGRTLHDFIQGRTVTVTHALSYSLQLCDALQYAHDHGIIHRDIKPSNLLINSDGRLKVADFGLSRPTAAHDQEIMMGTPDYAAPEISQGQRVDQRADVFAFGVLIYEMLTGVTPAQGRKPASALATVEQAWDDVIGKATRPDARERYQSVKEMRGAIAQVANRRRYAPGAGQSTGRLQKRSGGGTGWLVGIVLACVVAGGAYLWFRSQSKTTGQAGTAQVAQTASPRQTHDASKPTEADKPKPTPAPSPPSPPPPPLKIDFAAAPPGHLGRYPQGHKDHIWGVVLFPDSQRAASAGGDRFIKIWKVMTGELLRSIKTPSPLFCLAISNDGRHLAGGSDDGKVRVWDAETGDIKAEAPQPGKNSFGVAFSPDDHQIISVSHNKPENVENWSPIEIWPWAEGGSPKPLEGWTHPITALLLTPEGQFVTGGNSPRPTPESPLPSEICVGSLDSPKPIRTVSGLRGGPWRFALSPGQKYLAISYGDVVWIDDFQSLKELSRCAVHEHRVDCLRFLDGGRLIITGSEDKSLRIWETATGKEVWRAALDEAHATSFFAVDKDETFVVSGAGWASARKGVLGVNDDEVRLHLWKLPVLASLRSAEAVDPKAELANLPIIDAELAKLKSEVDGEWQAKMGKGPAGERSELDQRYMDLLRKAILTATPSERGAFIDEVSRTANNGPVPITPPHGAPPALQNLMKYYLERVTSLKQKSQDTAKILHQSAETRFTTLETLRRSQGDTKGAARVKLLWQQWSKAHG